MKDESEEIIGLVIGGLNPEEIADHCRKSGIEIKEIFQEYDLKDCFASRKSIIYSPKKREVKLIKPDGIKIFNL